MSNQSERAKGWVEQKSLGEKKRKFVQISVIWGRGYDTVWTRSGFFCILALIVEEFDDIDITDHIAVLLASGGVHFWID